MNELSKYDQIIAGKINCFFNVISSTITYYNAAHVPVIAYSHEADPLEQYSEESHTYFLQQLDLPVQKGHTQIVIFEKLAFILIGLYEDQTYKGFVVVGPVTVTTSAHLIHELTIDGSVINDHLINNPFTMYLENLSKLLRAYLEDPVSSENISIDYKRTAFNPYNFDAFFVDSMDYVKNEMQFGDMSSTEAMFETFLHHIIKSDKESLKMMMNSILNIPLPTPTSRAQHVFSDLRVKKNIMLSFFSVMNYIIVEEKITSDFYLFFNSVIMTELEIATNEAELRLTVNDLIDRLFTQVTFDVTNVSKPIRSAMFYINNNLDQRLTLDAVAKHVYLNPKYLSRLFQQESGISFKAFVSDQKIKRAKSLLKHTKHSISDIAMAIGIDSTNNFASFFKKHTGTTPTDYRKNAIS